MSLGLGPLERFLAEPEVHEVMVHNGGQVWIEDHEGLRQVGTLTPEQTERCIEHISRSSSRRIDLLSPVLDGRLTDGTRACVVIPPVAVHGASINLRRFPSRVLPLAAFGPQECTDIVRELINEEKNVVVAGETSSGKTSLLSAVSRGFGANERIVCIEDTHELRLAHPHAVHLQTRSANQEGLGAVSMGQLVRTSLRMRPDRLIVGEVRGAEAIDMLLAMTSGHRGCWSTLHATSASDTLSRITNIIVREAPQWTPRNAKSLATEALDAIVHTVRTPKGKRRIGHIVALDNGRIHDLYGPVHPDLL